MNEAVITTEQDSMTFGANIPAGAIDTFIEIRKDENKHVLVLAEDLDCGGMKVTFKERVSTVKEYTRGGVYFRKTFVSWMH